MSPVGEESYTASDLPLSGGDAAQRTTSARRIRRRARGFAMRSEALRGSLTGYQTSGRLRACQSMWTWRR